MQESKAESQVVYLGRENLDDAINVLSQALAGDPLFAFLFEKSNASFRGSLTELFRFSCEVRFDLGWPLLGCVSKSRLVGVAGLSEPEQKPWPESLERTYDRFRAIVGSEAAQRLERYSELADSCRPKSPHFYLGVLGIHPAFQGGGFGGLLMKEVLTLSESHPRSIGVGVDTENAINVPFYERFGYSLVDKLELGEMEIWCMFRRNQEGGDR